MVADGLYPAQINVLFTGEAVFKEGLTVGVPTVQVEIVTQSVVVHPYDPPVLRDCTIMLPVAPVVTIAAPLV